MGVICPGSVCVSLPNSSPHPLPPRILEEQALREYVLALFRLPRAERLHEVASCSVWTPHARCHTAGTLYTTDSYLCFSSREEGTCTLLIPLSEVQLRLPVHQQYSVGLNYKNTETSVTNKYKVSVVHNNTLYTMTVYLIKL